MAKVSLYVFCFLFFVFCFLSTILLSTGCSTIGKYTSLDISVLPCEQHSSSRFFYPIELNESGSFKYESQLQALTDRFDSSESIKDIVLFVHGWNKNASSAEDDYQNFFCRLTSHLEDKKSFNRNGSSVVIGLFWPSTITGRRTDPYFLKPISYYRIRRRIDHISNNLIGDYIGQLLTSIEYNEEDDRLNISLVGHSLGGRLLANILNQWSKTEMLENIREIDGDLNIILINAAMSFEPLRTHGHIDSRSSEISLEKKFEDWPSNRDWLFSLHYPPSLGWPKPEEWPVFEDWNSFKNWADKFNENRIYLYNIHSYNDKANAWLFPLASIFNSDLAICAIGACGVPHFPTLCTGTDGIISSTTESFESKRGDQNSDTRALKADTVRISSTSSMHSVNVDVTPFVFSHSDIYKGRMASLLASVIGDEGTQTLSRTASFEPPDYYPTIEKKDRFCSGD